MAQDYIVETGDCMSSIAHENGFFWQTLWDYSANADLKNHRKNPNVLMKGDVVHIPDLTCKQVSCNSETKYKFVRKGIPEKLRIKLFDANHKPRANLDYIIVIDGNSRRGQTDDTGELIEAIPPNAKIAKLIIEPLPAKQSDNPSEKKSAGLVCKPKREILSLKLGHLDPILELSGVKGRLMNFKLYKGPLDSNLDDNTKKAIINFQKRHGLPVTGIPDDATRASLQKQHGH